MSRYDVSRASNGALCAVVRVVVEGLWPDAPAIDEDPRTIDATTRKCLESFANTLLQEPAECFRELDALRAECRVKTRAEYDREIGDLLRWRAQGGAEKSWLFDPLHALVEASQTAPEGEP